MTTPHIEKLEWADIRKVLPNEAQDFTPWLAGNLDLLADALGIEDLALVALRVRSRTSASTSSRPALTRRVRRSVVIENQYGATDHDHLGKLITTRRRPSRTTTVCWACGSSKRHGLHTWLRWSS